MSFIDGAVQMRKALERILASRGLLEHFLNDNNFHAQISNESFLPLVVQRSGQVVVVAHVMLQNGDVVSDPEMTFKIERSTSEWLLWPTSLQFATGHREDSEVVVDGKILINPRARQDQIRFSTDWARSLISQGFHRPHTSGPDI